MLKWVAAILLIIGSSGIGFSIVKDEKKRICHLHKIKEIIMIIQNEIQYGKSTFPEICMSIEKKCDGVYQEFFRNLNQEIKKNNGENFCKMWKKEASIVERITCLKRKDKEYFYYLPIENMYQDKEMQKRELEEKIIQLQKDIEKSEKKLETNTRVYLSIGIMGGIFLCILFW